MIHHFGFAITLECENNLAVQWIVVKLK